MHLTRNLDCVVLKERFSRIMKNFFQKISIFNFQSSIQKGFTLIELLVVIGILGVLAAALVATLDPFEQLNRGQDTANKALASEFLQATTRYYSNRNALPWSSTAGNCYTGSMTNGVTLSNLTTCINTLVSEGELKSSFSNSPNLSSVTVTNPGGTTDVIVCFLPKSKAQQEDSNTRYTATGGAGTSCKSTTTSGGNDCYWCLR